MAAVIKPIGAEVAAPLTGFAIDLGKAKVFRVVNTDTIPNKITILDKDDVLVGDTTLVSGGSSIFFKATTDKIFGSAITLLLTPLAKTQG